MVGVGELARRLAGLVETGRSARARALVGELERSGALRVELDADPTLLAVVLQVMRPQPAAALRLAAEHRGDRQADALRYELAVSAGRTPVTPPVGARWGHLRGAVSWGLLLQGRLDEVGELTTDETGTSPDALLADVLTGRLDRARSTWRRLPAHVRRGPRFAFVHPWLCCAEGRVTEALDAMAEAADPGEDDPRGLASRVYAAFLLVLGDRGPDRELAPLCRVLTARGELALTEWAMVVTGLGHLRAGEDEVAAGVLRAAVESMSASGRLLWMPSAAAAWSEAARRLGDSKLAASALDLAYRTSWRMGPASYPLLSVLRLFPDVARGPASDIPARMRWRARFVAPAVAARAAPVAAAPEAQLAYVDIQPFGERRDVYVDGEPRGVSRRSVFELVASMALNPGEARRERLRNLLFPDMPVSNADNNLRQALHQFTRATGVRPLASRPGRVDLPPGCRIDGVDLRFVELSAGPAGSDDETRGRALRDALREAEGGYLVGSSLDWVVQRRHELEVAEERARLELSDLFVRLDDPRGAQEECEKVLARNGYCEPAYQRLLAIESLVGSESSTLAVWRRAAAALGELGLSSRQIRQGLGLEVRPLAAYPLGTISAARRR